MTVQVYTNLCSLNVPEDDIECEYFMVISIDSLLPYKTNILNKCVIKLLIV